MIHQFTNGLDECKFQIEQDGTLTFSLYMPAGERRRFSIDFDIGKIAVQEEGPLPGVCGAIGAGNLVFGDTNSFLVIREKLESDRNADGIIDGGDLGMVLANGGDIGKVLADWGQQGQTLLASHAFTSTSGKGVVKFPPTPPGLVSKVVGTFPAIASVTMHVSEGCEFTCTVLASLGAQPAL